MSLSEYAQIQSRLPNVTFVDADELVGRARRIKSPGEIERGNLIQVDGGAVFKGFCADIYRNAFVGSSPPKRLQEYAEGCRFIQSKALDSIQPGATSADICAVAEAATREIGFERLRRTFSDAISAKKGSMIGHGLGFSVHEFPMIAPSDETEWMPGMCGALEIAFGDSELGWIEWEDNFLVTTDGMKNLTPLAKRLWLTEA